MNDSTVPYARKPGWIYIGVTLLIAIFLTVIPVSNSVENYWPDWITLVVFYWVLVSPATLGVMFGWMNGLIEDVVTYSLLGQHALGKALIGTVVAAAFQRLRIFSFLEKMAVIFILQSINIAISAWTNNLAFGASIDWILWQPALSTALVWPLVSFLLDIFEPGSRRGGITR
jgi:rod shape-determining protein MreD